MTATSEDDELAADLWSAWTRWDPDVQEKAAGVNVAAVATRSLVKADELSSVGRDIKRRVHEVRARTQQTGDFTDDSTRDNSLAYAEWLADEWTKAPLRQRYEFPVTPYVYAERTEAIVSTFSSFTFDDNSDVEQYIELVQSYADYVRQTRETLWGQFMRGIVIPAVALDGARTAIEAGRVAIENQLRPNEVKLRELNEDSAGRLGRAVERALSHDIATAYADLLEFLDGDYRAAAPDQIGFGQYAGGDEYYRQMVQTWTTTNLDPETIHRIGHEQVDELSQRLARVDRRATTRAPRWAPASPSNPEELTAYYTAIVEDIASQMQTMFGRTPAAPWRVQRLNPNLEATLTYGYYSPPTGAANVGTYYFNGRHIDRRTIVTAPSLMAHEVVPGHHWQISTQLENLALPAFRREPVLCLNAYIEGWAEYAANLGWEMGLFEDSETARGRVENELFLAQRLVVDTGLNAMGWTQDQALAYLVGGTSRSPEQLKSEVLRYGTDLPGQALAYRLGHLEFDRIRQAAASRSSGSFDVRSFHDELLAQGALPLPILSDHMDRWSAVNQGDN